MPDNTYTSTHSSAHTKLPLVLASGSQYRKAQIEQLQLNATCQPANIDETPKPGETAKSLAARLAQAKAQHIASIRASKGEPPALIIGCDQTASCDDQLLSKPGTAAAARQQLGWCSNKRSFFYSALCIINSHNEQILADTVVTEVQFRALSEEQIKNYIALEQPLDCAGSFKCEGLGITLFKHIRSDDPSALIGLPLIRLTDFLMAFNQSPI